MPIISPRFYTRAHVAEGGAERPYFFALPSRWM